jgi:hypothetical protein
MLRKDRERRMYLAILWAFISFLLCVIFLIWFFNSNRGLISFYAYWARLLAGLLFGIYGVNNLIQFIKLSKTEVLETDDVALEIAKKLVGVPKLDEPCLVSIERPSRNWVGGNYPWSVHLYDIEIGTIKNGETFKFLTVYPTNALKIYTGNVKAVIDENFQAIAGGEIHFIINNLGELEEL